MSALENNQRKLESSAGRIARTSIEVGNALDGEAKKLAITTQKIIEHKARIEELTRAKSVLVKESAKDFVGPTVFGGNTAKALSDIKAIDRELKTLGGALSG